MGQIIVKEGVKPKEEKMGGQKALAVWVSLFATSLLFVVAGSSFGQAGAKKPKQSRNEQLTTDAWRALEAGKHLDAVAKAEKCIEAFEASATKVQKQLQAAGAKVPKGEVTDEQKAAIHKNGLLNDVATCYFIKAKALEGLKKTDEAKAAYRAAASFHLYGHGPAGMVLVARRSIDRAARRIEVDTIVAREQSR
jgi:hypothetical protein